MYEFVQQFIPSCRCLILMHIYLHFKILKISLIKSNKTENPYFLPTPSMIVFSELIPQFRYTSLTGMSVMKKKCQMSISPLSRKPTADRSIFRSSLK